MLNRRGFFSRFLGIALAIALGIIACQPQSPTSESTDPQTTSAETSTAPILLNGTGASFPFFIYQRWFEEYNQIHSNVQINYQPTGSEVGIQQMIAGTIDFGASDIAMTDDEITQVSQGVILLPITAGSVAIAYNLPGIESGLKLPRSVYPEIFSGAITTWTDPKIAEANPDLTLPDLPIILVHRADGSGTTAAVTSHLSAISPAWESDIGSGLSVPWPTGVAVKANAGVSAQIQQAEGAIGYVEYAYAQQLNMTMAALENQAGQYVLPGVESAAKALSTVVFPENLRAFAPDPEGAESYPIATYSWILVYQTYEDATKAETIRSVLQWCLTEGQKVSAELGYVPLPETVAQQVMAAIEKIQT
ncbi:MAG: phosphate ABC transporter substrate-binding protein PstS [Cyanobacteria bacterium P01_A01_bin.123]